MKRRIAVWTATSGARYLILMIRSASSAANSQDLFQELEAYGCYGTVVVGDVSELSDVSRAIVSAEYPIRGVLQGDERVSWDPV